MRRSCWAGDYKYGCKIGEGNQFIPDQFRFGGRRFSAQQQKLGPAAADFQLCVSCFSLIHTSPERGQGVLPSPPTISSHAPLNANEKGKSHSAHAIARYRCCVAPEREAPSLPVTSRPPPPETAAKNTGPCYAYVERKRGPRILPPQSWGLPLPAALLLILSQPSSWSFTKRHPTTTARLDAVVSCCFKEEITAAHLARWSFTIVACCPQLGQDGNG
nr:hypothetical protein Iba_chr06cCG12280 [Ipomoea batatas]